MKLEFGDMWQMLGCTDLFLITGNSFLKTNGEAVMGRGLAKEATERIPSIAAIAGKNIKWWVKDRGYPAYKVVIFDVPGYNHKFGLFQVKYHFRDEASIPLIRASTRMLKAVASNYHRVDINFPGIGNGRRNINEIMPIIQELPDNVHVWQRT